MKESQKFELKAFFDFLSRENGALVLRSEDDTTLELSAMERSRLAQVLVQLAGIEGKHSVELSSQGAATRLGVSRPTLIRLADAYGISHRLIGKHRRYRLEDILKLESLLTKQRVAAFDEMRARHESDGEYLKYLETLEEQDD